VVECCKMWPHVHMQVFLRGVGRRMKPGGVFFVVDSFRRPGVSHSYVFVSGCHVQATWVCTSVWCYPC
jgi:predicted methyltransferase